MLVIEATDGWPDLWNRQDPAAFPTCRPARNAREQASALSRVLRHSGDNPE